MTEARLSLVVPLRNEESSVELLLDSIVNQSRPPDEVVIVDAGSRDRTASLVRGYAGRLPLTVLSPGPLFPGEARNHGVASATHDWIAFTDGGIRLHRDWLAELEAAASLASADVVFGAYEPVCDDFFRQCAALVYVSPLNKEGTRGPSVASCLLKRTVFQEIGGFTPFRAAEDLIFIEHILARPYRIAHAANALAYWQIAGSVGATYRRFSLYSFHNLIAGRGRQWHWGVLRQYLAILLGLGAAHALGIGPAALLLIPAWLAVRAAKAAWTKRRSFSFEVFHPGRILGTAMILAVVDAATFAGALRFLREGRVLRP